MRTLTAILLLCAPLVTWADGLYRDQAGSVVVFRETACESVKVLVHIPLHLHTWFKAAELTWRDKVYEACWDRPPGVSGMVLILDEAGDVSMLPESVIKFDLRT